MTTFALISTIASLILFGGWLALSAHRFGWLGSYSAYASKWTEAVPLGNHTCLWSIVTILVAMLLCPAMIEAGDESPLQVLGFAAPVYLGVVSFTPKWETDKRQKRVHVAGALICAVLSLLWLIFALRLWFYPVIAFALALAVSLMSGTLRRSYVFWGELALFAAVYAALIIGGF
jgi:hypothetical protein